MSTEKVIALKYYYMDTHIVMFAMLDVAIHTF